MRTRRRHSDHVVRMFPDYAESVLWFAGPVPYPETGLNEGLVAELRAWEEAYYAGLDDFEWRSRALRRQWEAAGLALARRVAAALGSEFAVERDRRLVRTAGQPEIPAAAAAFTALATVRAAEQARIAELGASGAELGWYAYSPMSDPDPDSNSGGEPTPRTSQDPDH